MKNKIAQLDHVNFTVSNFKESVDWYGKAMYLLGVAIIYLVAGFFVIPVG